MGQIIDVQKIQYWYASENESAQTQQPLVLDQVDLKINRGEFVAVVGHNGSGKSTLAKHFNGILVPMCGRVLIEGMDTKEEARLYEIRQKVGMVFQNPDNQIVATIVEEDVAFAPENLGLPRTDIIARVEYALQAVGMEEYRAQAPHKLSGGQKQRVAIAGVIAMFPDCIVLDEPTAMLDPLGRKEVLSTIRRLNKNEGITAVLITHYMNEAAQADRVIVMDNGKILMDAPPREVFQEVELLRSVGLEVPPVASFAYELRKKGYPVDEKVLFVPECVDAVAKLLDQE